MLLHTFIARVKICTLTPAINKADKHIHLSILRFINTTLRKIIPPINIQQWRKTSSEKEYVNLIIIRISSKQILSKAGFDKYGLLAKSPLVVVDQGYLNIAKPICLQYHNQVAAKQTCRAQNDLLQKMFADPCPKVIGYLVY